MHYVSLIIEFLRGRPAVVFLDRGADASRALDPDPVAVLQRAARRGAAAAGHRPRIRARQLSRAAAGVLAGRDRLPHRPAPSGSMRWRKPASSSPIGRCSRSAAAIVGTRHAVLGVLLMVGIAAFTVPSPDFGPAVLAAPLWALALLHYWRAVGEGQRGAWFLLALDLGLLLLASYVGLILIALDDPVHARDRARAARAAQSRAVDRRAAARHRGVSACRMAAERARSGHLRFQRQRRCGRHAVARRLALRGAGGDPSRPRPAGGIGQRLAAAGRRERAPEIERNPVEPFARRFVYFFALAPAACAIAIAFASGRLGPLDRVAPLVVLSGLAVVVAAGDQVLLYRERLVSSAWLGLLVAPPVLVVLGLFVLPWTVAVDLKIAQPANVEGQFFADNFQRRTGKPLAFVTGDARLAPLVALGAPKPAACLFRLGAAAQPVGEARRYRRARRHAGVAGGRQCRHAAGDAEGAVSPPWCRKCRARSRVRSRACCR